MGYGGIPLQWILALRDNPQAKMVEDYLELSNSALRKRFWCSECLGSGKCTWGTLGDQIERSCVICCGTGMDSLQGFYALRKNVSE